MSDKLTLEIVPKIQGSAGTPSGGSGTPTPVGGANLAGGVGLKGLGKMAGILGAILVVANDIFWAFKPVMKMLGSIFKLLGAFLRPIAEVIVLLLKPLISIMRPFFKIFQTMMAPFMNIIREMGSIASQQAAEGDMAGAMKTSVEMFKTAMGPMIVAFADIIGELTIQGLTSLLGNVTESLMNGFGKLISFIPGVGKKMERMISVIAEDSKNKIMGFGDTVSDTLRAGSMKILSNMEQGSLDRLSTMKDNLSPKLVNSIEEPITETVKKTNEAVTNEETGINKTARVFKSGVDLIKTDTDSYMGMTGKIPTKFNEGIWLMNSSVKAFSDNMAVYADRIDNYLDQAKRSASRSRSLVGRVIDSIAGR